MNLNFSQPIETDTKNRHWKFPIELFRHVCAYQSVLFWQSRISNSYTRIKYFIRYSHWWTLSLNYYDNRRSKSLNFFITSSYNGRYQYSTIVKYFCYEFQLLLLGEIMFYYRLKNILMLKTGSNNWILIWNKKLFHVNELKIAYAWINLYQLRTKQRKLH